MSRMRVTHEPAALARERAPICLAAGFFDGVHRGHARVIEAAKRHAAQANGTCWVLTFDAHPRRVLGRPGAPALLTCMRHKLRLFEEMGVHGCLLMAFTPALAARAPRRFLADLARAIPAWGMISAGGNWRFGHGGAGGPDLLQAFARARGIRVETAEPVRYRGAEISSTRIRDAVRRGAVRSAAAMLGRPFSLLGVVVRGGGVGRKLGFPTANLRPSNEVRPADGVYACAVRLRDGRVRPGVMNVGRRPTLQPVTGPDPALEVHLPGFKGRLYGQELEVYVLHRLRGEKRFAHAAALKAQIARDVRETAKRAGPEKLRHELRMLYKGGAVHI